MRKLTDTDATDVLIVGGGIVGCATAYHLAQRGLSVRIVERGPVGGEQSSRAWGFVRQQGRHPFEVPIAALAAEMWRGLQDELGADLEYMCDGIVLAADTEADEQRLLESIETARRHGVQSRMLSSREVAELAPNSAVTWRAGLFAPNDAHAEPARATAAFAAAARQHGVAINEFTPAIGIDVMGGAATGVVTAKARFNASTVICAGGIGTADLAKSVDVNLPILPVRAPVVQTNPGPSPSKTAFWAPHVAFRPKRDGSYYLGNGYREIDAELDLTLESFRHFFAFLPAYLANHSVLRVSLGRTFIADLSRRRSKERQALPCEEPEVNRRLVKVIEREFYKVFPAFSTIGIQRTWAGRIDATPDLIPIIDHVGPRHFIVAAGFNGHGFTLSPAIGRLLAELVIDGKPSIDLGAFGADRFARKRATVLRAPL